MNAPTIEALNRALKKSMEIERDKSKVDNRGEVCVEEVEKLRETMAELKVVNREILQEMKLLRHAVVNVLPNKVGKVLADTIVSPDENEDCFCVVPSISRSSTSSGLSESSLNPKATIEQCCDKLCEKKDGSSRFNFNYDSNIDLNRWLRKQ